MRDDFAIFILTHGRAANVHTIGLLEFGRYTGRLYLILDDEDEQRAEYEARYPGKILIFSKVESAARFDEGDNFQDRRSIIYARNVCWDFARSLGLKYFMQFEDDYSDVYIRWDGKREVSFRVNCLDAVLEAMIDYFETIPALTIAMSQGGDHIGGWDGMQKRKAMNSLLCSVDRPFQFVGRLNDDTCTYTTLGFRGELFLTIPIVQVNQFETMSQTGGNSELYREAGTYWKSFYSVMMAPSAVKIGLLRDNRSDRKPRVHHAVDWGHCVPKIIPERFRKAA